MSIEASPRSWKTLEAKFQLGHRTFWEEGGPAMATGLVAAGYVGLRVPTSKVDFASSRSLLGLYSVHLMAGSGKMLGLQLRAQSVKKRLRQGIVVNAFLPADPWAPGNAIDSQSIASSLFAASLFPYLGFLYHLTKSKTAPPLTLFGFYFLLAFVGATIPAGIYAKGGFSDKLSFCANVTVLSEIGPAKLHYGTSLSNVDWLHGSAESLLTVTNLLIVFGLRGALRNGKEGSTTVEIEQEEELPLSK